MPLDALIQISDVIGYPTNGIAFVLESIIRAEELDQAEQVCNTVIKAARERYGDSSRAVLLGWKIIDKPDIGRIVAGLSKSEMIELHEQINLNEFNIPNG